MKKHLKKYEVLENSQRSYKEKVVKMKQNFKGRFLESFSLIPFSLGTTSTSVSSKTVMIN